MARLARVVVPGLAHHVMQRGNRRQKVFFTEADREAYLEEVGAACKLYRVAIWAWCLMPNHVHFVAVPETEDGLARCFGRAHARYTRRINFREGWRGYLWQGRFGSSAMDWKHVYHAVRYVERNPVRAGLAPVAWEYAWSSARFHVGESRADPLCVRTEELEKMVGDWRKYLLGGDDPEQMTAIRKETSVGQPLGDGKFIKRLESDLGLVLRRRPPGRPRKGSYKKEF